MMRHTVLVVALAAIIASPVDANEIDQIANNLETSCSNHFRKRPNRPSSDSRKFCSCFAAEFSSVISLRELDAANGIITPEIQEQFERSAQVCSHDVAPSIAQTGRAWIGDTN